VAVVEAVAEPGGPGGDGRLRLHRERRRHRAARLVVAAAAAEGDARGQRLRTFVCRLGIHGGGAPEASPDSRDRERSPALGFLFSALCASGLACPAAARIYLGATVMFFFWQCAVPKHYVRL
jgi:hypothetical protein